jgi:hypothetical protein
MHISQAKPPLRKHEASTDLQVKFKTHSTASNHQDSLQDTRTISPHARISLNPPQRFRSTPPLDFFAQRLEWAAVRSRGRSRAGGTASLLHPSPSLSRQTGLPPSGPLGRPTRVQTLSPCGCPTRVQTLANSNPCGNRRVAKREVGLSDAGWRVDCVRVKGSDWDAKARGSGSPTNTTRSRVALTTNQDNISPRMLSTEQASRPVVKSQV